MRTIADFRQEIANYIAHTRQIGRLQECPLCEQGSLIEAEVRATGEQISFCEECDSIWPSSWDCQDFRVWAGIMGKKESHYVPTQRTCDSV